MTAPATLVGWRARHRVLQAMLRAAARVAPERDEARFRAAWDPFEAALRLHLHQEERTLLPAFDAIADRAAPNQRPDVVRADHDRIRGHLDAVARRPAAGDPAGIVARAEHLALLDQVLDHHDRREAGGMLPLLDAAVDPATRAAWLAAFAAEEAALPPPPVVAPRPAPPPVEPTGDDPADRLAAAAAQDGDLERIDVPPLPGANGARVTAGLREAVARVAGAADLVGRRDALSDVLDALRRWRAVRDAR